MSRQGPWGTLSLAKFHMCLLRMAELDQTSKVQPSSHWRSSKTVKPSGSAGAFGVDRLLYSHASTHTGAPPWGGSP